MKTLKKSCVATVIASAILAGTSAPALAGSGKALGMWLSMSAFCAGLALPPVQLTCAVGAGVLTGLAYLEK